VINGSEKVLCRGCKLEARRSGATSLGEVFLKVGTIIKENGRISSWREKVNRVVSKSLFRHNWGQGRNDGIAPEVTGFIYSLGEVTADCWAREKTRAKKKEA